MRAPAPVLLLLLLALAGCMPATWVRVEQRPVSEAAVAPYADARAAAGPSRYTDDLLRRVALSERLPTVEAKFAAAARADRASVPDRALALGELALEGARRADPIAPDAARARDLLAAAYADEALVALLGDPSRAAFDDRVAVARRTAAVATGRFVDAWLRTRTTPRQEYAIAGRRFAVVADDAETRRWLATIDDFRLAATLEIDGLRSRHVRDGLGVPLVAWRAAPANDARWHYGPDGLAVPLTAVLEFDRSAQGEREIVRLRLRDSRRTTETCFAGRAVPLAADLTAPLAYAWSRSRAALLGRQGLSGVPEVQRLRGFRLLEPYDPRRIPVVLVHGLGSSPQAWRNLTNEILGADALHQRYQVWLYAYPTSDPFVVAAARFRADLRELIDDLGVPSEPGLVVVGHSMGGLLAKSLVVDSGTRLWDAVFADAARAPTLDAAERAALESALVLKPWPEVRRVVFLATPHGGSSLADAWWARLVETVIRPTPLLRTTLGPSRDAMPNAGIVLAEWRAAVGETSVAALSPHRPLLRAFRALPVASVPFHTIYGRLPGGDGDGVVLAADARLDGATSELALPVRHGEFDTPPVVDELLRILETHAASTPAPPRVHTCAERRLAIAGD